MEYGSVPGIDKPVSRLVQGTVMLDPGELDKSFRLLDAVYEAGCTAFDTAHVYAGGACERALGKWIRSRGVRDEVMIIGKGAHPYDGRNRVTPEDITSDIRDSLDRMDTDHIDLYLLHRDDPQVSVGLIVQSLDTHRKAGRIGAYGGSNWTHERIDFANRYADSHRMAPFAASSPHFSLAKQIEPPWEGCLSITGRDMHDARDWYRRTPLALFVWSSLAGGFFSGRFRRDNIKGMTDSFDQLCVMCYCVEENFQRLGRAETLASERGVSVAQIALAYVLHQPMNIFALVGCRSGDEFRQNARVFEIELSPGEMAWLNLESDTR